MTGVDVTSGPRVAVTGVGLVTGLGSDVGTVFDALCRGERAIRPVVSFDVAGHRCQLAAEVPELVVAPGLDRSGALAVEAARGALASSRVEVSSLAIAVGATAAGMREAEAVVATHGARLDADAARRLLRYTLSSTIPALRSVVADPARTAVVCTACSSGAAAIALGAAWIRQGRARAVLAGGVDALCWLTFAGFDALGALDPAPCRPFDRSRGGLTLGEGAAFLVLEREDLARARGAQTLCFLDGWALGSEAHHITQPEPSGAAAGRLITLALRRAGSEPDAVGYVNAHGTGTPHNDLAESRALNSALGERARSVPVSSTKGQLGHTLGAAGAIEAVVTVMALVWGRIPPTAGLTCVDPEIRLRLPTVETPFGAEDTALSSSFGFGGAGVVLALRRRETVDRRPGLPEVKVAVEVLDDDRAGDSTLDPARSRRFDWQSTAVARAAQAGTEQCGVAPADMGLVVGGGFGNVSRAVAWLARLSQRGPRAASPAEFPQLVPSAAAGNASVYSGCAGPVLTVFDHGAAADAALHVGAALLHGGDAHALVVGAAEPQDPVVSAAFGTLAEQRAGWLLVTSSALALDRPSVELVAWEEVASGRQLRLPPPREPARARVVVVGALALEPLLTELWSGVARLGVELDSLAASAVALRRGVALIADGGVDEVLVISEAPGRARVTHLRRGGA